MKKSDLVFILVLCLIFAPFIAFGEAFDFYRKMSGEHAMVMGFLQYALFATMGEMLGKRFQTGSYCGDGFGAPIRALVWGAMGLTIVAAIQIFGSGTPVYLDYMFGESSGTFASAIFSPGFSGLKLLGAFFMAFFLDVFFSPLFIIVFGLFDMHIKQTGGTVRGFFSHKVKYSENLRNMDWSAQWKFVFMKTIPLFWIPMHTVMYLLPGEFQVLMSSTLNIVLGIILFLANRKNK